MNKALFQPKRADGQAEWQVVYALFRHAEYGALVRFDTLREALGHTGTDPHRIYAAVRRAAKALRKFDARSLESVRSVGYRVLEPQEHERQERTFRRKGQRQVQTALEVNRATALERLDDSTRKRAIERGMVLAAMLGVLVDHEARIRRQEALIDHVQTTSVETVERLNRQEAEIQRLRELVEKKSI